MPPYRTRPSPEEPTVLNVIGNTVNAILLNYWELAEKEKSLESKN
ncbi:MAG: hypothetical protein ACKPI8_12415 [Microcystis panniformis]